MRRIDIMILLCLTMTIPAVAQRRGSAEVGGSVYFRTHSDAAQRQTSELGVDVLLGYYFSPSVGMDFEPGVRFGFYPDSVSVSMLFMNSIRIRLLDMAPGGFRRPELMNTDLGISSSVFLNLGAGMWSEGWALPDQKGETYTGPALMAGIGTQSRFGRFSTLRVKVQYIELFPSGPVFSKRRSMMQVGVGFGIFIRS